jgi:hypothetical protein
VTSATDGPIEPPVRAILAAVERTGDGRWRLGSEMAELGRLAGAARLDPAGRPA